MPQWPSKYYIDLESLKTNHVAQPLWPSEYCITPEKPEKPNHVAQPRWPSLNTALILKNLQAKHVA